MRNRLPLNAIVVTGREKKPAGIDFDIVPTKKREKKVKEEVQPELFEQVYNDAHYDEYKKTKNKNLFEEVIEKMMLESCYDESFQPYIEEIREIIAKKMPVHKKRFAILCILDKNRNLMRKAKIYQDGDISMMEHIKDYVQILRKYVRVSEVEKKKFGEVMTPIELVTEMLNKLPREVWSNPNLKWLDPCNGVGPFGALVVAGLMKGLAKWETDEEKRYKHILENMVYVCELQPKNMFLWLSLMDPQDRYEMNVYCGSFLDGGFDKHMKEVWGIEKFDIVVGNPPYQETSNSTEKSSDQGRKKLWMRFIEKVMSITDLMLFVTPNNWLSKTCYLNEFFQKHLISAQIDSSFLQSTYFSEVGSTFSYYLLSNKEQKNPVYWFNTNSVNFNVIDLSIFPTKDIDIHSLSIFQKVLSKNLPSIEFTREKYGNLTNLSNTISIDRSKNKGFVNSEETIKDTSSYWFTTETREQADILVNNLNLKLYKFLIKNLRSGMAIVSTINLLPIVFQQMDDKSIYRFFNLTKEEIVYIENIIK